MKKLLLALVALPASVAATVPDNFPDLRKSWYKEPLPINTTTLRQLVPGMDRHQVYRLLGAPHFSTGIMARRWNYAFSLVGFNSPPITPCQLRLTFEHRRLSQIDWSNEACAVALR